ncbi:MAG: HD domain-containing protein [Planctomycetales bacterium]|nr:HD domain-containing protein [Planctomycetales bacterium]
MSSFEKSAVASEPLSRLVQIPTCILKTLDRTKVDIFLRHAGDAAPVLYREAGYPLSEDRACWLERHCDESIFVRARDYGAFSQHLVESLEGIVARSDLEPTERYEVLQVAVERELESSLRLVNSNEFVAASGQVGDHIAQLLAEEDVLPNELFQIVRHDYHTFVHVTNVSGFAVLLAKELGIRDAGELRQIAIGGLLHDVGKRFIPRTILNKPAALTQDERTIIQTHPQLGYEEVCQRDDLTEGQLMMVYQHHEFINGGGYPVGVMGDEIHPWAKLLAVVDVFEAVTGQRPYRSPAPLERALEIVEKGAGTQFDEEMARCWISAMQRR